MPDNFQTPSDPPVRSMKCSADERDQRLMLAEEILSDLATGYWVAVLDDNDDPVKERMGQRILNYWRTWDSPPNNELRRGGPETHDKNPQRNPPLPASNG